MVDRYVSRNSSRHAKPSASRQRDRAAASERAAICREGYSSSRCATCDSSGKGDASAGRRWIEGTRQRGCGRSDYTGRGPRFELDDARVGVERIGDVDAYTISGGGEEGNGALHQIVVADRCDGDPICTVPGLDIEVGDAIQRERHRVGRFHRSGGVVLQGIEDDMVDSFGAVEIDLDPVRKRVASGTKCSLKRDPAEADQSAQLFEQAESVPQQTSSRRFAAASFSAYSESKPKWNGRTSSQRPAVWTTEACGSTQSIQRGTESVQQPECRSIAASTVESSAGHGRSSGSARSV